jgi:hypothetical protein
VEAFFGGEGRVADREAGEQEVDLRSALG